ncbi:hypothetical protein [Mucilaginibacter terrae]|uniref:TonB C-terminal domain-containing protein n=1 Tax=Mucilaginibacter terrae TaxID=1955052 RepID=A0ABU3GUI7_9SPHI|nr:hypothetical protein [Mucilaginibacter terrae]MDT3403442.1 hypothetical protein [Mucilaginibacter terrae]
MKYILAICCLFAASFSMAQAPAKSKTQSVFYFKYDGSKVPVVDSADYIRVISLPDSGSTLFGVADYYRNSKPKLMGKTTTIDPLTLQDQCVSYYSNGKRESVMSYADGRPLGTSYLFYPNGKVHLTLEYDTAAAVAVDCPRIISCLDSTGKALVTDGNGHYVDYNYAGAISEEGDIRNARPDGVWHGSYPDEKVTYIDTYRDGKFVSGVTTNAAGVKYTYTKRRQSPEFKGGEEAFVAYIKKKFKYPATLKQKSFQGVLTFLIDQNGKVSQGRFLGNITPEINKTIVAAINTSPAWKPAIQNGLPVSSSWVVSALFGTSAKAPAKAVK